MKSSATVIAQSLGEFGRCLKETELPNDVETTEHILEIQTAERDAIKVGSLQYISILVLLTEYGYVYISTSDEIRLCYESRIK